MAEPESSIGATPSWLLAAWPGMGNVAVIAAGYLIQKLKLKPVVQLSLPGHFDIQAVEVKKGLIATPRLPQSFFFRPSEPLGGADGRTHDLTVFFGESQPSTGAYAFANLLLDRAREFNARRIVTFASMASQMHPTQPSRVHGAATQGDLLSELGSIGVDLMDQGQIGGMNGVLLGAAAERGLAGMCLLGEIPYYAAGVGNPKAARAILSAFAAMTGIRVELDELDRHAEVVDRALEEMLTKLQEEAQREGGEVPEVGPPAEPSTESPGASESPERGEAALDEATRQRLEKMFAEATKDRSKAVALKQELDRLGVFGAYENRFLDLFRRAE